jgi:hypothetical protein
MCLEECFFQSQCSVGGGEEIAGSWLTTPDKTEEVFAACEGVDETHGLGL